MITIIELQQSFINLWAAAADDIVAPRRAGRGHVHVGDHITPVEAPRTVDRTTDVEQAIAEHRIHARGADVLGGTQRSCQNPRSDIIKLMVFEFETIGYFTTFPRFSCSRELFARML